MLILTADGYRTMRPLVDVICTEDEVPTPVQVDEPLPGCASHADAGVRFSEVLGRFLRNDDSRFLDRHWQDAKDVASRGMVG